MNERDEILTSLDKIELRPAVAWFAEQMELTLRKHDGNKSGWDDCSYDYLLDRLAEELEELDMVVLEPPNAPISRVIQEAADVANFAMMIADNARHKR